jgi:hypothetical protein
MKARALKEAFNPSVPVMYEYECLAPYQNILCFEYLPIHYIALVPLVSSGLACIYPPRLMSSIRERKTRTVRPFLWKAQHSSLLYPGRCFATVLILWSGWDVNQGIG